MQLYYTFLDEHGDAGPENYKMTPYYAITAILTNEKGKSDLENKLNELKAKYFGSKLYILHRNKLHSAIKKRNKNMDKFVADLEKALDVHYFVFQVIVDKEKAFRKGWDRGHIYNQSFRVLLSNLVKFSIARGVKNIINSEASSVSQDIHIYKNFFHFIANGIPRLNVTPEMVKKHQTSLNFVTKANNDAGEQLADLLSKSAVIKYRIDSENYDIDNENPIDKSLYKIAKKKLSFIKLPANCKEAQKKKLYPSIKPYKVIP